MEEPERRRQETDECALEKVVWLGCLRFCRMTYIDQIYHEQKTRATPGVGKYDLELSEKEKQARIDEIKKRKIPFEDRPNFLCEYEHLSQINPGPG